MSKAIQNKKSDGAAFFKAARKGDVIKLKKFLGGGQTVDARDGNGKTALMMAAENGQINAVKALLTEGANANLTVPNKDSVWRGCNALMFAVQGGDSGIVELLIKAGAAAKGEGADGTTLLGTAVGHKSVRMVKALLAAKCPVPKGVLVESVWEDCDEITELLIAAGADVNARNDLGQSVLHRAAENGKLGTVRALIGAKVKLNPIANGTTPLLIAIQKKHTDCALELINAGSDGSITDGFKRDALMNAAISGQIEIVRALLKAGASRAAKDRDGMTVLMHANEKKEPEITKLLLESSEDVSGYHLQELIRASIKGDAARVRDLLEAGADVNATARSGARPLFTACKLGRTEIVRMLLEAGAKAHTKVKAKLFGAQFSADALAVAVDEGHIEIVRMLIKAGADVNESSMINDNLLDLAANGGHADIIRELVAAGFSVGGKNGIRAFNGAVHNENEAAALALLDAGVRAKGVEGAMMLNGAAAQGLSKVVKALLACGADPKIRNQYGETALQAAQEGGHKHIVAILKKASSPQDSPNLALIEAAEKGDFKTVNRLILEGVNVDVRDSTGATALIRAAGNSHNPVVRALLDAGADPNASTPFAKPDKKQMFFHMEVRFETPLSAALGARNLHGVEMLLDAGADIKKTECGHLAAMILQEGTKEAAEIVDRLLDAGLDPDSRWHVIRVSLLGQASQENMINLVEKLIQLGARLKSPRERDMVIEDAIGRKRYEVARMLIKNGVASNVRGTISSKALLYAAEEGHDEIIRLLLEKGVPIDGRADSYFGGEEAEGVTALMAAARFGHIATVQMLLGEGADPKAEDAIGRTAFDWVQDNKNRGKVKKISEMLEKAGRVVRR